MKQIKHAGITRRSLLGTTAAVAGIGFAVAAFGSGLVLAPSAAQAQVAAMADEKVQDTLARLFGDREILDGSDVIELDVPAVAENGAMVQTKAIGKIDPTADRYIKDIYIIADNNARPLSAHYSFTEQAGDAMVGTNIRLASTTPLRAVAELNDGTLFQVIQEVRVTAGGCGG